MEKKLKNNLIQMFQIICIVLLIIANLYGIYYCFNLFTTATATQASNATPISSKLVTPLNSALYKQIKTDQQNRHIYTDSSNSANFGVNEVFVQK